MLSLFLINKVAFAHHAKSAMVYISVLSILSFKCVVSRHFPENCPINNEKMKKNNPGITRKIGRLGEEPRDQEDWVWTVIP